MPDSIMTTEAPMYRNRSATIAELAKALSAAQKNFAPIAKDREVTVTPRNGSPYKFKYATLDAIRNATMPALAEQGLALTQALTEWGNSYAVETTLYHSSGEWTSNVTPMFLAGRRTQDGRDLPPGNQELGSAQTYARRYGLSALLCVTADEDDDGNHADGNHADVAERVPYRPVPTHRNGVRQASASGARMAAEEPELVANAQGRMKGQNLPSGNGKKSAAEKAKEWTDNAIGTLNLSTHTVESLSKFESDNDDKIEWLKENAPGQYDRFAVALDNASQSARAKVAA